MAIQADPGDVLCPLISAIPDPDPGVRANVQRMLFSLLREVSPGIPAMASLLMHRDAAVRRAAVEAFAAFNAAEAAAPALPQLLTIVRSDEPDEVRRLAMIAITHMGGAAEPALGDLATVLVNDRDPEVRALVARVAQQVGPRPGA
jgi:HEAT repeat protein